MAKVSILMNCYNCRAYLKEALDSIYAQSFGDWEVIFVDNCSGDGSEQIVRSYDERIRYYRTDSLLPLGAARNFGLSKCGGEYIAFLDTDDAWLPEKLELQVRMMESSPEFKMCYGGVIFMDRESRKTGKLIPQAASGFLIEKLLRRYEINMQSVLLRNDAPVQFNDTFQFAPDYDLFMQIAAAHPVGVLPQPLVRYRRLEDSLTSKKIALWWVENKTTLDTLFAEHPDLKNRYPRAHERAYAKVAYYKAQYLASVDKMGEARNALAPYRCAGGIYFLLYAVLFLPKTVWRFIHKFK